MTATFNLGSSVPSPADISGHRLTIDSSGYRPSAGYLSGGSVFLKPYKHKALMLPDGAGNWTLFNSDGLDYTIGTSNKFRYYDIFAYNNSGTPTLTAVPWDTTHASGTITDADDPTPGTVNFTSTAHGLSPGTLIGIAEDSVGGGGEFSYMLGTGVQPGIWRVAST